MDKSEERASAFCIKRLTLKRSVRLFCCYLRHVTYKSFTWFPLVIFPIRHRAERTPWHRHPFLTIIVHREARSQKLIYIDWAYTPLLCFWGKHTLAHGYPAQQKSVSSSICKLNDRCIVRPELTLSKWRGYWFNILFSGYPFSLSSSSCWHYARGWRTSCSRKQGKGARQETTLLQAWALWHVI